MQVLVKNVNHVLLYLKIVLQNIYERDVLFNASSVDSKEFKNHSNKIFNTIFI